MLADPPLFVIGQMAPRLIGDVLDAGSKDGAAMGARQQALAAKIIEILADGLRRHIEFGGQFLDIDPPVEASHAENVVLSWRGREHGSVRTGLMRA